MAIFKVKDATRIFFYYFSRIQRIKLRRKILSNLRAKFFTLNFTLPAGLVHIGTSSQVGDSI